MRPHRIRITIDPELAAAIDRLQREQPGISPQDALRVLAGRGAIVDPATPATSNYSIADLSEVKDGLAEVIETVAVLAESITEERRLAQDRQAAHADQADRIEKLLLGLPAAVASILAERIEGPSDQTVDAAAQKLNQTLELLHRAIRRMD